MSSDRTIHILVIDTLGHLRKAWEEAPPRTCRNYCFSFLENPRKFRPGKEGDPCDLVCIDAAAGISTIRRITRLAGDLPRILFVGEGDERVLAKIGADPHCWICTRDPGGLFLRTLGATLDQVLAVTRARLMEVTEERDLQKEIIEAIQDERQRIGQDLHDGLGQNLTAVAFLVELLSQKMTESGSGHAEDLRRIETIVKDAIRQARSISRMVSPVEMEQNGFNAAIETMTENVEKLFNVKCTLFQDRRFIIDDHTIATHLFYIAREALDAALKHRDARHIVIRLDADNTGLVMTIRDDGRGPQPETDSPQGMTWKLIHYRSKMIGAAFETDSEHGGGFVVRVRLAANRKITKG